MHKKYEQQREKGLKVEEKAELGGENPAKPTGGGGGGGVKLKKGPKNTLGKKNHTFLTGRTRPPNIFCRE
jgi:hypothetical protein